jgi:hypothetical protein
MYQPGIKPLMMNSSIGIDGTEKESEEGYEIGGVNSSTGSLVLSRFFSTPAPNNSLGLG